MKTLLRLTMATAALSLMGQLYAQEEQIVIEDLSRAELRSEIAKIENEYYRVFNASTDDVDLKVECYDYTPTGSHIKQRACEPKFLRDARNANVRAWQNQVDELASNQELQSQLTPEFDMLTTAMNALLLDDQYFRELNAILRMLRERQQELEG